MTPVFPRALLGVAAILMGVAAPARGQLLASERATLSQTVDGTTVSVEYSRPLMRGRAAAFGDVVAWDHRWTPGANWATVFEFDKPVEINGTSVPQGRWSVWVDLSPEKWVVILDPREHIFHTRPPEDGDDQIRLAVPVIEGPRVEVLTFSFPMVRADGMDLLLQWDRSNVLLAIEIESTFTTVLEPDAAAPFPGIYDITLSAERLARVPPEHRPDSIAVMTIEYRDGSLMGRLTGGWWGEEGWDFVLVPRSATVFNIGFVMEGTVAEVWYDEFVEFVVEEGRAVGVESRIGDEDELDWKGTRRH
ncbi:MAG: DUF2911 domain-containing protein [Gemmatimonadota bacterium]|nr:DUF2911 domain-containing protein [Gemmatimonadota bacterium]MDH5759044.1 DUF2911 domain-containing protein [Gemmatimonadota bacterium]